MKVIIQLFMIAFLSTVCSCVSKPCPRLMQMADSLMDTRPDSALSLLAQLEGSIGNEPESTQMYYRILTIKAKENTHSIFTSDNLIKPLLNYYEKKKDQERLPEIYYYAGMIYYIIGDLPRAQIYLQKALDAFKGSTNYRILYKIHRYIGLIYKLNPDTYAESVKPFRKAYRYAELTADSTLMTNGLLLIARGYQGENIDSMSLYYKKASDMAQKICDTDLYNSINIEWGMCYFQEEEYKKAYDALQAVHDISINYLPAYFSTCTRLFYETGRLDSAQHYCKRMLSISNQYHNKDAYYNDQKKGYKMMSQIADKQGNRAEALEYLHKSLLYADSLLIAKITTENERNSWQYNYQIHEKENYHLSDVIQKQENRIVLLSTGIICILTLVLSACIIYLLQRKQKAILAMRQKEKLEDIVEEQYQNSQEYIIANEKRIELIKEKQRNIENQKNEMEKMLQETEKELLELTNRQIETKQKIRVLSEQTFKASQIYKDFYHVAEMPHSENISDKKKITPEDWEELTKSINGTYNNFTERLEQFYPNISTHEIRICMLLKMEIPPISIANLTARSKQAINSSRKKLYEKTHNQAGSPDLWDKFIQKF
ncbi:hypothetical protein [Bacteroides heparinolyticus]|uniref:tetratricopeptide repeat protein n=1 Tax=Prevotella heparinolytica TaxID=28113 RepID=UPI003F9F8858